MGAAICAGVGVGVFPDFSVIKRFNEVKRTLAPQPQNREIYQKLYEVFNVTYESLLRSYEMLAQL